MSSRKRNASDMAQSDSRVSAASTSAAEAQQPTKKKARTASRKYWLGKIPSWLAKEWFSNDDKYAPGSKIGKIDLSPTDNLSSLGTSTDGGTNKRSLTVFPPESPSKSITIPKKLIIDLGKEIPSRLSMKHGDLVRGGKDQSLIFLDKPAYSEGCHVKILDDLSGEILKAKITNIHNDRTYDVTMNGTMRLRQKVSDFHMEVDSSIHDTNDINKISKCTKKGLVTSLCTVTADKTDPYFSRWMIEQSRKNMAKKRSAIISAQDREASNRERTAERRQQFEKTFNGRRGGGTHSKSGGAGTGSGMSKNKRVRKSKEEYQKILFSVFQNHGSVTQKELEKLTHEPWQFIKDVIPEVCVTTGRRGNEGKVWALKPEYRLFSDSSSSSSSSL